MFEEKDNKERIKAAAHELIMQYGIRSVSMDDIAANLGISKKTIYQSYKDKDELITEVVKDITQHNRTVCEYTRTESKDPIQEIFMSLDVVAEMFSKMNPAVLFDLQKYHPLAYKIIYKHKNEFLIGIIKKNLQAGIEQGIYRNNIDVDILSRFRVHSMFIPFSPEFFKDSNFSLYDMLEQITFNFMYGLVTPKGYHLIEQNIKERIIKKSKKSHAV